MHITMKYDVIFDCILLNCTIYIIVYINAYFTCIQKIICNKPEDETVMFAIDRTLLQTDWPDSVQFFIFVFP